MKALLQQLRKHFPHLDPQVFRAVNTRHIRHHHTGCALSHRMVIQDAKARGHRHILVFEEDARLHNNFKQLLKANIGELKKVNWDILYLGACVWNPKPPKPPRAFNLAAGCELLKIPTRCTCTHGIAYHENCYDYILDSIPQNISDTREWCGRHAAIDQWFMYKMQGNGSVRDGHRKFNCYMTEPRICSQPFLIGENKQDNPKSFRD